MFSGVYNDIKRWAGDLYKSTIPRKAMSYIHWYIFICVMEVIAYFGVWLLIFYFPESSYNSTLLTLLDKMLSFMHETTSSPYVAAIAFGSKWLVDKNDDGVPDPIESEDKNEKTAIPPKV